MTVLLPWWWWWWWWLVAGRYLAHPNRSKVNFTLLLQPEYWFPASDHGANETFDEEIARYVSYFNMPEYQARYCYCDSLLASHSLLSFSLSFQSSVQRKGLTELQTR